MSWREGRGRQPIHAHPHCGARRRPVAAMSRGQDACSSVKSAYPGRCACKSGLCDLPRDQWLCKNVCCNTPVAAARCVAATWQVLCPRGLKTKSRTLRASAASLPIALTSTSAVAPSQTAPLYSLKTSRCWWRSVWTRWKARWLPNKAQRTGSSSAAHWPRAD